MSNFEMKTVQLSMSDMLKRVARVDEMKPSGAAFIDTVLPGYARETFNVIGLGVTENSDVRAAIPGDGGFNVTYIRSQPGARGALHAHPTVEVFIPLSGQWAVIWNDDADFDATENQLTLNPGDCISVPPGVMRCFKNVGNEEAMLLVIFGLEQGRNDGGRVMWPKDVLEAAERHGIARDASGQMVKS
jgi:quercetin dioxygenase-like cupin family protein